ncbi:MAG: hypothetical protein OEW84_07935, partial [Aigarchaeota archaeon]|nr:hypothetical protein [Aigarchaeota archaeon]
MLEYNLSRSERAKRFLQKEARLPDLRQQGGFAKAVGETVVAPHVFQEVRLVVFKDVEQLFPKKTWVDIPAPVD